MTCGFVTILEVLTLLPLGNLPSITQDLAILLALNGPFQGRLPVEEITFITHV